MNFSCINEVKHLAPGSRSSYPFLRPPRPRSSRRCRRCPGRPRHHRRRRRQWSPGSSSLKWKTCDSLLHKRAAQLTNRRDVHVALGDGLQPLLLLALEPRELKVLVPGLVHLGKESTWIEVTKPYSNG